MGYHIPFRTPAEEEYEMRAGGLGLHIGGEVAGGGIGGDYYVPPGGHHLTAEDRPAEASTFHYFNLLLIK